MIPFVTHLLRMHEATAQQLVDWLQHTRREAMEDTMQSTTVRVQ
jgi:hypothetical protein